MISINSSIKDKLEDDDYINSLSDRRRGEIKICKEMLSDEELEHFCSITVAYRIARKRYIIEKYGKDALETTIFVRYNSEDEEE